MRIWSNSNNPRYSVKPSGIPADIPTGLADIPTGLADIPTGLNEGNGGSPAIEPVNLSVDSSVKNLSQSPTDPRRIYNGGLLMHTTLVTIPRAKLIRKLGDLNAVQLAAVETVVRRWLGL